MSWGSQAHPCRDLARLCAPSPSPQRHPPTHQGFLYSSTHFLFLIHLRFSAQEPSRECVVTVTVTVL